MALTQANCGWLNDTCGSCGKRYDFKRLWRLLLRPSARFRPAGKVFVLVRWPGSLAARISAEFYRRVHKGSDRVIAGIYIGSGASPKFSGRGPFLGNLKLVVPVLHHHRQFRRVAIDKANPASFRISGCAVIKGDKEMIGCRANPLAATSSIPDELTRAWHRASDLAILNAFGSLFLLRPLLMTVATAIFTQLKRGRKNL